MHFLLCDILYAELTQFVYHFHKYSTFRLIWNRGTIAFYLCTVVAIFNFYTGELLNPIPPEWLAQIDKNCAGMKRDPKSIELKTFVDFYLFFTMAGTYFGLIFE